MGTISAVQSEAHLGDRLHNNANGLTTKHPQMVKAPYVDFITVEKCLGDNSAREVFASKACLSLEFYL